LFATIHCYDERGGELTTRKIRGLASGPRPAPPLTTANSIDKSSWGKISGVVFGQAVALQASWQVAGTIPPPLLARADEVVE